MKILTAAQMREVDRITIEQYGVPGSVLMENAGAAVVRLIEREYPARLSGPVAVLCGKGNNGGDGFVVARLLLARGSDVRVVLLAEAATLHGDAARAFAAFREAAAGHNGALQVATQMEAWQRAKASLPECTLVVDAIFGTGLSSSPSGFFRELILDVNRTFRDVPVVAVDIPSGLPADEGARSGSNADVPAIVQANWTVTYTAPKLGQLLPPGESFVGRLRVDSIGTPPEVLDSLQCLRYLTTPAEARGFPQPRRADAHKGSFGHVLVLGGSVGKSGAVAMASEAALRIGAGLVTAAVPRSVLPLVAAYRPELMTEPLAETEQGSLSLRAFDFGAMERVLSGKTVVALGPGLTTHTESTEFAQRIARDIAVPMVVDADGLNAFAGHLDKLPSENTVLTPHPGEAARLLETGTADVQRDRLASVAELSRRTGAVVVLKGHRTLTAAPDGRVFINPTGNPGMATGGTGDVLTGVIAGLLAQFLAADRLQVTAAAVYLHGLAGDLAAVDLGEMSLAATDITRYLAAAIQATRRAVDDVSFEL